ncbi:RES family NAD+ phosphorylase [Pseudomonas sp. H22_DOA]|nr:RES family NAD+ phosphorylase [Pseudomonas sp. H22_DOA]
MTKQRRSLSAEFNRVAEGLVLNHKTCSKKEPEMLQCENENVRSLKRICYQCVGEAFLSAEVKETGLSENCSYCGKYAECEAIEDFADYIETAFEEHYDRTPEHPASWEYALLADGESSYEWDRDGEPVIFAIQAAADIPEEAAKDVQVILEERHEDFDSAAAGDETEFASGSYYEGKNASDMEWQQQWIYFEQTLKTEARFFSRYASAHLDAIFGRLDKLSTVNGHPLIVRAGAGHVIDHLYRARVFQSDDKLHEALCRPDLHIGSPPFNFANSGRMNARGISVFYGATQASVAIAEVRPPVGSKVASAKFDIIRPLQLLDLTALEDVQDGGSIFDPSLKGRLERVAFLRSLGRRMTKPVMPDDEAFEYLPTQAIADFLATENAPSLDGIIFQSAQSEEGRNVVLFHKAARAELMQFAPGTELKVPNGFTGDDGGWGLDYSVWETYPEDPLLEPIPAEDWPEFLPWAALPKLGADLRRASLRVAPLRWRFITSIG